MMNEMMSEIIRREDCFVDFSNFEGMKEFLEELSTKDVWEDIPMHNSYLKNVIPDTYLTREDFKHACEEDISKLEKRGGFYLYTEKGNYVISPLAFFTLKERLGINCRAAGKMMKNEDYERFVTFANIAFSMAGKNEGSLMLIRGDRVIAMHSPKYDIHDQYELVTRTQKHLDDRFVNNRFRCGHYSHERTVAKWSLGSKDSPITKEYIKACKEAGFDESELKGFHPTLTFATSDIGTQTVEYYPQITMSGKTYTVGTPIKIKHIGGKTIADVENALEMVFSAIKDGSTTLAEMIKTKIEYPIETFVAACKVVGLDKTALKMINEQLEIEKLSYGFDSSSNAFLVYDAICNITTSKRYAELNANSKLRVGECLTRLMSVKWTDIDKSGARDFR